MTSVTWPTGLTGLDIDSTGQLTGTPVVADWGTLETKSFVVPVEVAFNNPETGLIETAKTNVTIIVDRDTDRDGIPDKQILMMTMTVFQIDKIAHQKSLQI